MGDVKAEGARSVAIGGNAINSPILTGDVTLVFQGEYEAIGHAYIDHASVFARLDLDNFVGRDDLIRDIDSFIGREHRGYLVLEAAPGLGKSAVLGWLVRQRAYVHHFVELTPGPAGIAPALKSLAAQLVLAYGLSPFGVIPAVAAQPHYLSSLLAQAAERANGRPIVLVVDGIDQAAAPEAQNVLGLPMTLPNGVFVIVSQQPVQVTLRAPEVPRRVFRLIAHAEQNLRDLRGYLEAAYDRLQIAQHVSRERFIDQILKKCDGRWQHMVLIVREIESGIRKPTQLEAVPNGLTQQYCALYQRCRDAVTADQWTQVLRPLLATIAAAEEPVSLSMLNAWLPVCASEDMLMPFVKSRPALVVADPRASLLHYRPEHSSLRDFLHGHVDRATLTTSELETLDEAATATRAALNRLASFYVQRFENLAEYKNGWFGAPSRHVSALDEYGLTHVLTHLEQSGRHEDAVALMWRTRKVSRREIVRLVKWLPFRRRRTLTMKHHLWTDLKGRWGTWADVAQDVDHLWSAEDRHARPFEPPTLSRQLRLSLLHSSLMSRISAITPKLASELVRLNLWSAEQSLGFAAAYLRGDERNVKSYENNLLRDLGEALVARGDADAAIAAVYMIGVGRHQATALGRIASRLPESFHGELLKRLQLFLTLPPHVMTGFRDETDHDFTPYGLADLRGKAAAALARALPPSKASQALGIVRELPPLSRVFASTPLIPRLESARQRPFIEEVHEVAQSVEDEQSRWFALARIAPYLPEEDCRSIVDDLAQVIEKQQPQEHLGALLEVAQPALIKTLSPEQTLKLMSHGHMLGHQLPSLLRQEANPNQVFLDAALESARANQNRWEMLAAAAPHLTGGPWEEIMTFARNKKEAWLGLELLAKLPKADRFRSRSWIIKVLREHALNKFPEYFVTALPQLAELGEPHTALSLAREMRPSRLRGKVLSTLVRYAPPEEQESLLDEALVLVGAIDDEHHRLALRASCQIELRQARDALKLTASEPGLDSDTRLAELAEHASTAGDPEVGVDAMLMVHDWRMRLRLLSKIAGRIPSSVLQSALTRWPDKDPHVSAEIEMARCIIAIRGARSDAAQTFTAHFDALLAIDNAEERALALTVVIPHLPPSHLGAALERALETICVPYSKYKFAADLAWVIVPRLDCGSLRRLLERLWPGSHLHQEFDVIEMAAMRCVQLEAADALDGLGDSLRACRTQQQVLSKIVGILNDDMLRDIFTAGASWIHNSRWATALADLARFFARRNRGPVAVSVLEAIDIRHQTNSRLALVDALPVSEFVDFWIDTFLRICHERDGWINSSQLRSIVPVLLQVPSELLSPALNKGLRVLALRSRDAYALELRELVPLFRAIGGTEVPGAIIEASEDVGRWFP